MLHEWQSLSLYTDIYFPLVMDCDYFLLPIILRECLIFTTALKCASSVGRTS